MKKLIVYLGLCVLALVLAGCGGAATSPNCNEYSALAQSLQRLVNVLPSTYEADKALLMDGSAELIAQSTLCAAGKPVTDENYEKWRKLAELIAAKRVLEIQATQPVPTLSR